MITRYVILVIVSLASFYALCQCPDFKPTLTYSGESIICELAPPSLVEYSFEGDPAKTYDVQLFFSRSEEWRGFLLEPGNYSFDLPGSNKIILKVSNQDGTCTQYAKDTVSIYRKGASQIFFFGD